MIFESFIEEINRHQAPKSFREMLDICESYKFTGSLKPYEKILYNAYIDFLNNYFHTNFDVEVSFRKPNKKLYFGYIDLRSLSEGNYKIIVEHKSSGILGKIGHEFTHLVQYKEGRLNYSEDEKHIMWKNKEYISIKDLSKITKFSEYKKIPWEAEAYENQGILSKLFLKSNFFTEIKGSDDNIKFLYDNNSLT